jgi:fructose-1,6-bisphosphatase II
MRNLPGYYSHKLAYGPAIVEAMAGGMKPLSLDEPLAEMLPRIAKALHKRVQELVIVTLNRPRHADLIDAVRKSGAALRQITDGDIAAARGSVLYRTVAWTCMSASADLPRAC